MSHLQLKNVKTSASQSAETLAFTATLYVDGKRAAYVRNDGRGGCHQYRVTNRDAFRKAEQHAAEADLPFDFERLDQVVNDLLDAETHRRWVQGLTKGDSRIVYRTPEMQPHQVRILNLPPTPHIVQQVREDIPNVEILNESVRHPKGGRR